jgi:hypothetical protein
MDQNELYDGIQEWDVPSSRCACLGTHLASHVDIITSQHVNSLALGCDMSWDITGVTFSHATFLTLDQVAID